MKPKTHTSDRPISSFKGLPYAKPPLGARRWKPAEALEQGSPETTRLASPMQQACDNPEDFFYTPLSDINEDCLYLNIWAPTDGLSRQAGTAEPDKNKSLPVMVWFYGGGLVCGSAHHAVYDGSELARKGVVVVAINYRVGVFGYFSHPALSAESPHQASGNYGTSDQIQALKWIRQHIADYGGDADNITLFGQSAGALSITHLMVSPLAAGLFHKAILQSAYLPALPYLKKDHLGMPAAEALGRQLGAHLKFSGNDQAVLKSLRELPAEALLQAAEGYEFDKAVVDGYTILDQVDTQLAQGVAQHIPTLAGSNRCEGSYLLALGLAHPAADQTHYRDQVHARYGELAENYLAVYPPSDLEGAAWGPIGNGLYRWGTEKIIRLKAQLTDNNYWYCFDHPPAWAERQGLGAFHSCELGYTFNNVQHGAHFSLSWPDEPPRDIDLRMADILSNYWVAFARKGNPAVEGQTVWRHYDDQHRSCMTFNQGQAIAGQGPSPDTFTLHDKLVSQCKRLGRHWTLQDLRLQGGSPF